MPDPASASGGAEADASPTEVDAAAGQVGDDPGPLGSGPDEDLHADIDVAPSATGLSQAVERVHLDLDRAQQQAESGDIPEDAGDARV